uniref:Interleukin 27 receptor, alpha n=1 Tax=Jaculus jaculus TaxID=51337 RepID=A0A8C5KRB3_JACJA
QRVAVPTSQRWVTIPREQLTTDDKLLVWGTRGHRLLWLPVVVNLDTQIKPDTPQFSAVEVLDEPLEAIIQWSPPKWPSHKVLVCQFQYRKSEESEWTQLEDHLRTSPLSPVEMHDLEGDSPYVVSGRCRVERGRVWGEWSRELSFRTPPPPLGPEDVWVSGSFCETSGPWEPLLVWKAPRSRIQLTYRAWFWVGEENRTEEGIPCCKCPIPAGAERAWVSAVNTASSGPLANLSLVCLAPESAPHGVVAVSTPGSPALLVNWQQGTGEPWGYVVDWVQEGDAPEKLNWTCLPLGNLSVLLTGDFKGGVPYRIKVTAVFPGGLAPAPSVWGFVEELVPLAGPVVWRLQDNPAGTPAVAWGEVPRHQLRGHVTHYSLCTQSGARPALCKNVSSDTRTVTLPDLHRGSCELWVTASTAAGQGPPGPSLWLHLPDNRMKILPTILPLWSLLVMGCGLSLATTGRCLHLRHKVLPRWVWEKVPDPANSHSGQPQVEEVLSPQPVQEGPILEVEEMEPPPAPAPPQTSAPLHSGYEKHFMPTPEELGLL